MYDLKIFRVDGRVAMSSLAYLSTTRISLKTGTVLPIAGGGVHGTELSAGSAHLDLRNPNFVRYACHPS